MNWAILKIVLILAGCVVALRALLHEEKRNPYREHNSFPAHKKGETCIVNYYRKK